MTTFSPWTYSRIFDLPAVTALFLSSRPFNILYDIPTQYALELFLFQLRNVQRLALLHSFLISPKHLSTLLRSTPNLIELELKIDFDHRLCSRS
ncbi:hypothetical protein BDQ12DRAFT_690809 [Crucibulum laeve]|uniref:Uncharacterized protein n=1 Tax=Crucibulum laeve TaxID=68775 RepID=A0A5C3LKU2_9AGAR|nr:hypothetical protein BDQ12DRAFT_690809 [Crucibulum laeve]